MKTFLRIATILLWLPLQIHAQLVISEVAPTNTIQIADADNEHPDWIELFNAGSSTLDLKGYSLSDKSNPKWTFPEDTLGTGERILLFASGKNRNGIDQPGINHWETAVNEGDLWHTYPGMETPPAGWTTTSFDDSSWPSERGGFGYGDDDDYTLVPEGSLSFYYRTSFNVEDVSKLDTAIMSMDYDDGFIAYLNGTEIFRSSNMPIGPADDSTVTTFDHEAAIYTGGVPEAFLITKTKLQSLLVNGQNVLAIELHNVEPGSSDLTGRTWLHFGINTSEVFYGPNPDFFTPMGVGSAGFYHTNFKIGFGETVRLFDEDGNQIDSIAIPYMQPGHSLMRISNTGDWCITDDPTPDVTNADVCNYNGYSDTPVISPAAGFYQEDQLVTIEGVNIHYTIDGSEPTLISPEYTGPITIDTTAILKARSFESGKLPGYYATATYFFGETSSLPILSITANPGDLFDDGSGGLAVYDNFNSGLKAPVHLEYFDKDKNLAFSENASLKPVGGYSIEFEQKSLQFEFDEEFGARDDVHYPIFLKDKPGIKDYKAFRVRNMDDDWNSTRMRDVVANRLAIPTHCAAAGYQHMAVFINGEYWGHYGGREVLNRYYVEDNHGADPDKVDEIFSSYFEQEHYVADEGTDAEFYSMTDFILHNDMRNPENFKAAQKRVDWENWVDYFAIEMYLANGDWFSSMYFNNLKIYRAPDLRWRYVMFDVTYAQNNGVDVNTNILDQALAHPAEQNFYTDMMDSLLTNPFFKNYFINRFADLMNEYWTVPKTLALIDQNIIEIGTEIDHQSERWGSAGSFDWTNSVSYLKDFHRQRAPHQRDQIQEFFGLTNQVDVTLQVQPAGAGVIKISTVVPTTYPWKGVYFDGNPVTITAIPNPGYQFDHWTSGITLDSNTIAFTMNITEDNTFTAFFSGAAQPVQLEVTEINYHSDPTTDAGDWFEIKNNASFPLDLSNYIIQDKNWYNRFEAPAGVVIQPNERLVIVGDEDKFRLIHPNVINKIGGTGFGWDNEGDQIRLYDRNNESVIDVIYDNKTPWACTPNGYGRTLERYPGSLDPDAPQSWFDGCMGGSPGEAFSPCIDDQIISEINYHSSNDHDAGDWFEVKNQQEASMDLSGWTLRDDDDTHSFIVPEGVIIPSGGYYVFCESDADFTSQYPDVTNRSGELGFGLGNGGDVLRLYDQHGILRLSICYDDQLPWAPEADGDGFTLELADPYVNLNDPFNWFIGCPGGSPGKAYDPLCTTGIQPVGEGKSMTLFPNPVTDKLNISIDHELNGEIRLINAWGSEIMKNSMYGREMKIDMKSYLPGIYFVIVTSGHESYTRKVIKNR